MMLWEQQLDIPDGMGDAIEIDQSALFVVGSNDTILNKLDTPFRPTYGIKESADLQTIIKAKGSKKNPQLTGGSS
jgi:hypothetical protein